jgi:hypothetical protein
MSTVPADASLHARRSDVEVGFVLVYTMVGYPVSLGPRLMLGLITPLITHFTL